MIDLYRSLKSGIQQSNDPSIENRLITNGKKGIIQAKIDDLETKKRINNIFKDIKVVDASIMNIFLQDAFDKTNSIGEAVRRIGNGIKHQIAMFGPIGSETIIFPIIDKLIENSQESQNVEPSMAETIEPKDVDVEIPIKDVHPKFSLEIGHTVGKFRLDKKGNKADVWESVYGKWHFSYFRGSKDYHIKGNKGPRKPYQKGYFEGNLKTRTKAGKKNASAVAKEEGSEHYDFCVKNIVPLY